MQIPAAIFLALAIVAAQILYGGLWRPIFAVPALFLVGVAGVLGLGGLWGQRRPASRLCLLSALGLLGWMLWSEWHTPDAWVGQASFRLTLGCLVTYLLFASVASSPPGRMVFVGILLVAGLIQSAVALFFYIRFLPGMPFDWLSEQLRLWYHDRSLGRAHGFYINANHLAWFLNFAVLFALSLASWARWPIWGRILALYFALVCLAGMLLTLSRGGFIGLSSGLGVFLLLSAISLGIGAKGKRWVAFMAVVGCAVIMAGLGFLIFAESSTLQGRLALLLQDSYRSSVFDPVVRQMQVDPLLGTGPGSFEIYGKTFRTFVMVGQDVFAHNDIAQLGADFGFLAFALFVIALILHFTNALSGLFKGLRRRMASHTKASSNSVAVLIGALSSATAFLTHSFFDFNTQLPANALLAAAVFGMLANSGVERLPEGWKGRLSSIWSILCILACAGAAGALLFLTVKVAPAEKDYLQAENALLLGQPEEAVTLLEKVRNDFPDHNRSRLLLARAYMDRGGQESIRQILVDSALALEELEAVERIFPLDGVHLLTRATAQGRLGKYEEARTSAIQAIQLEPFSANGYELLGMTSEAEGRFPEAIRYYQLAGRMGSAAAAGHLNRVERKMLPPSP